MFKDLFQYSCSKSLASRENYNLIDYIREDAASFSNFQKYEEKDNVWLWIVSLISPQFITVKYKSFG